MNIIEEIQKVLSTIYHPVLEKDIVTLGFVEDIKINDNVIKFRLVFPAHNPFEESIRKDCEKALNAAFPAMKTSILVLTRAQKTKKTINELGTEELSKVKKVIAVASGKGGVGKSTVAVNLAVALAKMGYKVGLADADVYGPSVPKMTGTEGMMPEVIDGETTDLIVPIEKFGVKWMSIGYFASPEQALIWRGPMACNALKQIIYQVRWGELDFLLIDLPPGTGDIHISLVHDTPLTGAVIVSTPQDVALADVLKGVNMFRNKDIDVPILGLVENMAWFTPAELPDNRYYIFGKNGGVNMAEKLDIPLLGQIPIYLSIREGGDLGIPASNADTPDGKAFTELARKLI